MGICGGACARMGGAQGPCDPSSLATALPGLPRAGPRSGGASVQRCGATPTAAAVLATSAVVLATSAFGCNARPGSAMCVPPLDCQDGLGACPVPVPSLRATHRSHPSRPHDAGTNIYLPGLLSGVRGRGKLRYEASFASVFGSTRDLDATGLWLDDGPLLSPLAQPPDALCGAVEPLATYTNDLLAEARWGAAERDESNRRRVRPQLTTPSRPVRVVAANVAAPHTRAHPRPALR